MQHESCSKKMSNRESVIHTFRSYKEGEVFSFVKVTSKRQELHAAIIESIVVKGIWVALQETAGLGRARAN
jgi:hypothetical protein